MPLITFASQVIVPRKCAIQDKWVEMSSVNPEERESLKESPFRSRLSPLGASQTPGKVTQEGKYQPLVSNTEVTVSR